ncbi:MAG: hypothetical protein AAFY88_27595 [Acidobacteriota bacterium]
MSRRSDRQESLGGDGTPVKRGGPHWPFRIVLTLLLLAFAALAAFFASFHPAQDRFYDERFALQNVHSVLQRGALEPANGYYPTLSYLPQALALGAIED